MSDHLKTQNSVSVAIDEQGRSASSSAQFFLENDPRVKQYFGNQLEFLICGDDGFGRIAADLAAARESVDIVCWGFDPAMELVRSRAGDWPRGPTYGETLERLAANGVKVRLLIWENAAASVKQDNMPGYTDAQRGWFATPYRGSARQKWCIDWWLRHLPTGSGSSPNPNLQIVLRDVSASDARGGLSDEEDSPSATERALMAGFGTHHQKPVLIDYAYDGGSKAVGYVMGLNSVTDYWDRTSHAIDDPLREFWSADNVAAEIRHECATEDRNSTARYSRTKPYQDYACRIVGPALERLHQNFVRGWNAGSRAPHAIELGALPPKIPTLPKDPNQIVQIVRTQPHEKEKTIKALYFQATSWARNYIYIENQYFFYPEFARHLKRERLAFCRAWSRKAGKPLSDVPKLHLFIVIPHPEQDGMVPRTLDMLTEFGHSDAMPAQVERVKSGSVDQDYPDAKNVPYTATVRDPFSGAQQVPMRHKVLDRPGVEQLRDTIGLQVSVARLRTGGLDANRKMAYREIYIHSKLMLIDDVFVTLGSANINQRSMAVDSEINVAASGQASVSDLRRRIFELHSGGKLSGSGDPAALPEVFKNWNRQMTRNSDLRKLDMSMQGFLLKFEDHRSTTITVA